MFHIKKQSVCLLSVKDIFESIGVKGGFCVANLVSLFALIPGLCIISAHQLQTKNYEVPLDGVKVVMVLRMRSAGEVLFNEALETGGGGRSEWQLRFVGMTYDGTERAPQKWKRKLFVRHGGPELVGWWIQDRDWKDCWPLEGNLPESVYASWDIFGVLSKT